MDNKKIDTLNALIQDYSVMCAMLAETLEMIRDGQDTQESLDSFYLEGWDANYSIDGNFYKTGPRQERILALFSDLESEGIDVAGQRQQYDEITQKVQELLPSFYAAHKESDRFST